MTKESPLDTALAGLAEVRARYWQHRRTDPWRRDEDLEQRLASAWASVSDLVDGEQVVPAVGAPAWSVGSPSPVVVSDSWRTFVAYDKDDGERCMLTFEHVDSVLFGGSNDEALAGHRLWTRGLKYYEFQEVLNSNWIAQREAENSVHDYHQPGWHRRQRHFVCTFHDETFECLAGTFVVDKHDGAPPAAVAALAM